MALLLFLTVNTAQGSEPGQKKQGVRSGRAADARKVFQQLADGKWAPATDTYTEKVTAARLTRFSGAVVITFDRPRRVKLAPADWVDTYMSRATCRNILIDLLDGAEKTISYEINAVAK